MTMSLAPDTSMPGLHDEYDLESSVYSATNGIVDASVKALAHHPPRNRKRIYCPYCGNGYSRKEHLERHIPSHTGLNPHRCRECFLSYPRKDLLSRHQQQHHSQVANSPKEMADSTQDDQVQLISCEACSRAKTKCDRALPSCGRCRDRNQSCVSRESKRGLKRACAKRNLRNAQTTVEGFLGAGKQHMSGGNPPYWPPLDRGVQVQYTLPDYPLNTSDMHGNNYAHCQLSGMETSPSASHAHHQSHGVHTSSSAYRPQQQALQSSTAASTAPFLSCVPDSLAGNFLNNQEPYEAPNYDDAHVGHRDFVENTNGNDCFLTMNDIGNYQLPGKVHEAALSTNQTWARNTSHVSHAVSQSLAGGSLYQASTASQPFRRGHNPRTSLVSSPGTMDEQILETIEHQSPMHQSVRSNSIFSSNGSTQVKTTETTPEPVASAQDKSGERTFTQHPLSRFNASHQETYREMLPPYTPEDSVGNDMYHGFDQSLGTSDITMGLGEPWNLDDLEPDMSVLSSTADSFDYGVPLPF